MKTKWWTVCDSEVEAPRCQPQHDSLESAVVELDQLHRTDNENENRRPEGRSFDAYAIYRIEVVATKEK